MSVLSGMQRELLRRALTLLASVDELHSILEEVAWDVEKFLYLVCHCGRCVWCSGKSVLGGRLRSGREVTEINAQGVLSG